ncbi:zinc-finger homeodomain protein 1 isoform X2 [Ziziphus jujuba]|uniref:Zinc-finger homeodomain protein 1 isoform X2 n=1 Tax=Ziziphus jujuba TaxID=326968 RepID=A0ABM3IT62_ZIZJJ|nr:zinc-finger homeodomain protein 1 isoform X2 [Ziziphus jujuba]
MEFEDQEEHEEEMELAASYDSLGNSGTRVKMPTPGGGGTEGGGAAAQAQPRKPRYRECLKNHAVGIGGHALDGCGEFMAAGAEGSLDALKCAACNCHRNFHRKETDSASAAGGGVGLGDPYSLVPHYAPPQFSPYYRTPTGYLHVAPHHRPLALPSTSGGGGSHSREDQEDISNPSGGGGGAGAGSGGFGSSAKKRFRTKFTQEQKDRMLALAERLGWRIQKQDEAVVQQFCNETGLKRHVLKVWMHNNKHTWGNMWALYQARRGGKKRKKEEAYLINEEGHTAFVCNFSLLERFNLFWLIESIRIPKESVCVLIFRFLPKTVMG